MGAQGTATLNFGAFPGSQEAKVVITGQTGILAGSLVSAWVLPAATADHSIDEHLVDPIRVIAGNVVAGSGFTIYGYPGDIQTFGQKTLAGGLPDQQADIYGTVSVAWVWN
jgi:hypothetical protein